MDDLTIDAVEEIHRNLTETDRGDSRIISEASIVQGVFRANLINQVIPRAAFVFYWLCAFPAFREGNERTALVMTERILADGDYRITGDTKDLMTLAREIGEFTAEPEDIERWLDTNTRKSPK